MINNMVPTLIIFSSFDSCMTIGIVTITGISSDAWPGNSDNILHRQTGKHENRHLSRNIRNYGDFHTSSVC